MGNEFVIVLVGVGMIALGIYFMVGKNGLKQPGDALQVEATIVDFQTETDYSHNDGRGMSKTTSTFPVYAYQVNGKEYRTQGSVGITIFSKDKYRIGATEIIGVNRDNPGRIYTKGGEQAGKSFGVILIIVGLISFLFLFIQ